MSRRNPLDLSCTQNDSDYCLGKAKESKSGSSLLMNKTIFVSLLSYKVENVMDLDFLR